MDMNTERDKDTDDMDKDRHFGTDMDTDMNTDVHFSNGAIEF
jgi:hypothetical protein